jgi:hypothetical protein
VGRSQGREHDAADGDLRSLLRDDVPDALRVGVHVHPAHRALSGIRSNNISPKVLAVPGALAQLSPPEVSNPSDNLKNLFEHPVLLYVLALYLFVTNQVDAAYVSAAW